VNAYDLNAVRSELRRALGRPGLSVVVVTGECRLQFARRETELVARLPRLAILPTLCQRCGNCYQRLGCAAIFDRGDHLEIDQTACTRCGLCYQVCDERAIVPFRFSEDPR
jgi:indolepyruvate ferredoxin oxidoreductase alpha subunit